MNTNQGSVGSSPTWGANNENIMKVTSETVLVSLEDYKSFMADKARLDWLETQDCWIGICGEYDPEPIYPCGGLYTNTVRETCDAGLKDLSSW